MIVFDRKDELQWRFVRRITRAHLAPPIHYLPTATGFIDAAALGLGWCLVPESLLQSALLEGRVAYIAPDRSLDIPLYWQHAAIRSDTLQNISAELRRTAGNALHKAPRKAMA
jgi:LysR family transcriptional regulator (chromosome initiation inhibitor)